MRRLQQLRIITTDGNKTNTDTAMTLLAELMRLLMNLGPRCKEESSTIALQNGLRALHSAHRAIGDPGGDLGQGGRYASRRPGRRRLAGRGRRRRRACRRNEAFRLNSSGVNGEAPGPHGLGASPCKEEREVGRCLSHAAAVVPFTRHHAGRHRVGSGCCHPSARTPRAHAHAVQQDAEARPLPNSDHLVSGRSRCCTRRE